MIFESATKVPKHQEGDNDGNDEQDDGDDR